ncbi:MAG: hypothetical protein CL424_20780 [Acidimicrobiaceae bacterium]|nr:hypothetical protein [Acidimicrobiaceae bacterium]
MTELATIALGAPAASWSALGFSVVDGLVPFVNGAIELTDDRPGVGELGITGLSAAVTVDGVSFVPRPVVPSCDHPNGARSIDHVVIMTDSIDRTSAAIEDVLGLERRRVRETETVRQAFHRFADPPEASAGERGCILELVEQARVRTPEVWGLVVIVDDLEQFQSTCPDLVAPPKPAVQPGRLIATARREADLGTAVAFMTP